MGLCHVLLSAGFCSLCVPWLPLPIGCPYVPPQHRLHQTPLGLGVLLVAFFYHPFTKLGGHLLNVTSIDIQLLCDLLIGEVQSMKYRHGIQTLRG